MFPAALCKKLSQDAVISKLFELLEKGFAEDRRHHARRTIIQVRPAHPSSKDQFVMLMLSEYAQDIQNILFHCGETGVPVAGRIDLAYLLSFQPYRYRAS